MLNAASDEVERSATLDKPSEYTHRPFLLLAVLLADSLIKIWSYLARFQQVDVLSEIWEVGKYSSPSSQQRSLAFHVDD
jgi:hypothetical protein